MIPERYKKLGFTQLNTPKKTPSAAKSHAVVIKNNNDYKLIRFGQQGVTGSPKKEGESEAYANRRKSFQARHAANIAKGKTSAAYWSSKTKWDTGGLVKFENGGGTNLCYDNNGNVIPCPPRLVQTVPNGYTPIPNKPNYFQNPQQKTQQSNNLASESEWSSFLNTSKGKQWQQNQQLQNNSNDIVYIQPQKAPVKAFTGQLLYDGNQHAAGMYNFVSRKTNDNTQAGQTNLPQDVEYSDVDMYGKPKGNVITIPGDIFTNKITKGSTTIYDSKLIDLYRTPKDSSLVSKFKKGGYINSNGRYVHKDGVTTSKPGLWSNVYMKNKKVDGGELCLDDYGNEIDCITRQSKNYIIPTGKYAGNTIYKQDNPTNNNVSLIGNGTALQGVTPNNNSTFQNFPISLSAPIQTIPTNPNKEKMYEIASENKLDIVSSPTTPNNEIQYTSKRQFGTPNRNAILGFGLLTKGLQTFANSVDENRQKQYEAKQYKDSLYSNLTPISGQSYGVKYGYSKYGGCLKKYEDGGNTSNEDETDFLNLLGDDEENNTSKIDTKTSIVSDEDIEKAEQEKQMMQKQKRMFLYQQAMGILNDINSNQTQNYNNQPVTSNRDDINQIKQAANQYGVPERLLIGVYGTESNFGKNKNNSSAGAQGPFQFMPATAKEMGIINPQDLSQASIGAAKYLKKLYNSTGNWDDALRGYNAGLGNVRNGRAYKIPETINYVKKVNNIANKFEQGGTYDLNPLEIINLKKQGYNLKYID